MDQVQVDVVDHHNEDKDSHFQRSLLNYWYPVTFSAELKKDLAYAISLFGLPLVLFRSGNGKVQCLEDRCSHRSTPLSVGAVEKGELECRYHGWRFGEEGRCTRVPSFEEGKPIPANFGVPSYPATERDGMIWVWPGDASMVDDYFPGPPADKIANLKVLEQYWDSNYSFEIMMENALDPAHLQFTHEGQQGKTIGPRDKNFPEGVGANMKIEKIEGGFRAHIFATTTAKPQDQYIAFYYPNYTHMEREKNPQMFICTWVVPMTKNTSRLMFRFYRSFVKWLPNSLFYSTNNKIAKQDQVVLTGQQLRIEQGAAQWNIPVKADILSLTFRKWWEKIMKDQPVWFGNYESTMKKPSVTRILLQDIEDIARKNIHPCVPAPIELQEPYTGRVQSYFPELWPAQYKKSTPSSSYLTWWSIVSVGVVVILSISVYHLRGAST